MKRWLALMLLLWALPVSALEVAGVKVADKAKVGASELVLNGAGIRTRAVFKVYVGALYLAEKTSAAAEALRKGERVALLLRDLRAATTSVRYGIRPTAARPKSRRSSRASPNCCRCSERLLGQD